MNTKKEHEFNERLFFDLIAFKLIESGYVLHIVGNHMIYIDVESEWYYPTLVDIPGSIEEALDLELFENIDDCEAFKERVKSLYDFSTNNN